MTLEDIFLLDGNVRPLWRLFLSLVLIFLAYSLVAPLAKEVSGLVPGAGTLYRFFFRGLLMLLALLGSFKVMTLLFEQKPLGVVGLGFHPCWMKELGMGLGVGGIMIASVGGAEALLGLARFARNPIPARTELAYGSVLFLILAIAAINEELVFRGYPFQKLVESLGPVGAVALCSAFFGMVHLRNPHHTWISTVNTMLAGIPFSIAYLRTRSLWLPVGMHFIWNYVQGFVLGLPISGYIVSTSMLKVQVHGAAWLTGADYGPEGGLLCTVAIVGAGIFLFLSARIKTTERMRELVFGPLANTAPNSVVHVSQGPDIQSDGGT